MHYGTLHFGAAPSPADSLFIGAGTWAERPDAASYPGRLYRCTDYAALGAVDLQSVQIDGAWYWVPEHQTTVYALTRSTITAASSTAEQYLAGVALKAGQLAPRMSVSVDLAMSRNNTTNNQLLRLRLGAAGTMSDTEIGLFTMLTSTQLQQHLVGRFVLMSATSIKKSALLAAIANVSSSSGNGLDAAITITSTANALTLGVTVQSAGTSTVATLESLRVDLRRV